MQMAIDLGGLIMAVETPSLLIIHQNVNMAKTLATLLAKQYNVYIAQLTSNVSELIVSNKIQLVLASQQLPDSTGLGLFSDLRRSHPEVVRLLLIPEADRDRLNLEEAITTQVIHRYLTEPLRTSHFLETVRKGVELYSGRTDSAGSSQAPEPGLKAAIFIIPDKAAEQGTFVEEAVSEPIDETQIPAASAVSEAEALESASLSYEAVNQKQREMQHLLDQIEEKQERIEQLEAVQKQLAEDREQLLVKMAQLQKENAALVVLRQENAALREEADRLRTGASLLEEGNEQLKVQLESLQKDAEKMQGELENMREQMKSLGMLKTLAPTGPVTPAELQQSVDPMEIYTKAAEWRTQVFQLQRLNGVLDLKLRTSEAEVARLHEEGSGWRSRFEGEQWRLAREARELKERVKELRHKSEVQEALCNRLQQERDELARKLLWMQNQWKAKLDQSGES